MEVASVPWECVASFLGTQEILFLRTVVTYLHEANLYREYGPCTSSLCITKLPNASTSHSIKSTARQENFVCLPRCDDWRCNEMFHWWPMVQDLSFLVQVPPYPAVSQPTFLIMESFVAAVDEAPTTIEVQEAVVAALMSAGFTNPEHLVGTTDSVVGELAGWLAGPAGGLLKRTFRCAEDVSEAKRAKAAAMACSTQSGHQVSQVPSTLTSGSLISLLGPEASAGAVASALTAGSVVG